MNVAVTASTRSMFGRHAMAAANNYGGSLSAIRKEMTTTAFFLGTTQQIQSCSSNNATPLSSLQHQTTKLEKNYQYNSKRSFVYLPPQSLSHGYWMEQQRNSSSSHETNSLQSHDNEDYNDNKNHIHEMNSLLHDATSMLEHDDVIDQETEYHARTIHVMSPTDSDISHNVGKETFLGYGKESINYDEDYDKYNLHMTPASTRTSFHLEQLDGMEMLHHEDVFDIRETRNRWGEEIEAKEEKTIKADNVFFTPNCSDAFDEEEVEVAVYERISNEIMEDQDYEELLDGAWDATDQSGYRDPLDDMEAYEGFSVEDESVSPRKGNL